MKPYLKVFLILLSILVLPIFAVADDFWEKLNFPYDVSIKLIRINQSDELFVGAAFNDTTGLWHGRIYRSLDYASSWEDITPDYYFPEIMDILIGSNETLYLGTWYGGVYRSYNNGDSFEQVNEGLSNTVPTELALQSDGTIYAGQFWGGGVDYSPDDGGQWYQTNFPMSGVNGLGIDNSDAIFASYNGIFYSDDNGLTWMERNNGLTNSAMINFKCFAFSQSAKVFTGTVDGIYISNNNGEIWENCLSCSSIYHIELKDNIVLAGTSGDGIYISEDGGNSWYQQNEGLENALVYSIAVDSENYVWCTTLEGLYRSLNDLVSIGSVGPSQKDLNIYPNPCDNFVNLYLPESSFQNAVVEFFTLNGRMIYKT
ncbi:MAG: hypothetical protein K8S16_11120, partial [Bacteroidales bacterium]|nr:hypothetical protein [Bacteroidales bacterium]